VRQRHQWRSGRSPLDTLRGQDDAVPAAGPYRLTGVWRSASLAVEQQRIPTSIPWWMGTAIFLAWLALVAVIVMLARYRFRSRRADQRPILLDDSAWALTEHTSHPSELTERSRGPSELTERSQSRFEPSEGAPRPHPGEHPG